jgi:hypothetical protein
MTAVSRADLLALTDDALAALANRGLLKRATRELDGVPPVSIADDGTITATFADGVTATLPPGHGLDTARCTCGAAGVCRHRLGAVLAYQRDHDAAPPSGTPDGWPGSVTDDELAARFGARTMTAARRRLGSGFAARVRRATSTVETPAATVRFLVPGELGFVDCDARDDRDALIVLAVWAFRRADAEHPDEPEVAVELAELTAEPPAVLAAAADAVGDVLRSGVTSTDDVLLAALRRERDACDRAGLRWPAAALDDLADQLSAYRSRSAHHVPERVAELIAEIHARRHAAGTAPSRVLGTEEPAETPLRQVRLIGLGCRVGRDEEADTAEVFLAHPGTETVLALRHRWARRADGANPAVAARRIAGAALTTMAAGNVVSEAAVRSAGRVVRFGAGRLARTTVSPLGDAWTRLPPALRPASIAAAEAMLAGLPPRLVRPRVAAELVRVLPVAEVREVRYVAGAQRLDALIADADGAVATISLTHRSAAPGALDALATALSAQPTAISGALRRGQGGLTAEPYAVRTESGVIVLDLADAETAAPPSGARLDSEPLVAAIEDALSVLADAAHRGLAHLPPSMKDRGARAAAGLSRVGLDRCTALVTAWSQAPQDPVAWLRAQLRLLTAAEVC